MNALTVSKPCLTPRGPPLLLFHNTHLLILVFFLLSVHTFFLRALAARAADASPLTPGAKPSPQGPSFSRLWVWLSCVAVAVARNLSSHLPKELSHATNLAAENRTLLGSRMVCSPQALVARSAPLASVSALDKHKAKRYGTVTKALAAKLRRGLTWHVRACRTLTIN